MPICVILEVVTTILSYRFTQLSRVEIEAMLGITFEQTRLYQDLTTEAEARGRQEGEVFLILRLLTKKFGEVPHQLTAQIENLSLEQIAALTFHNWHDLAAWLESLPVSAK